MKRSAAIVGPTPEFIRWAIELPCRLREIVPAANLPESTFRQLRSARELSCALTENRVYQGIAFHPRVKSGSSSDDALGFPVDEVSHAYGGRQKIQESCGNCVANTVRHLGQWAGCYGWLESSEELIQRTDSTLVALTAELKAHFELTRPCWYTLWTNRLFAGAQISTLRRIFEPLAKSIDDLQLQCFARGIASCCIHELSLHCELIPTGHSDGMVWSWDSHCVHCRGPLETKQRAGCKFCGKVSERQPARPRNVLGNRPYLQLQYVVGQRRAQELQAGYLNWKLRTRETET